MRTGGPPSRVRLQDFGVRAFARFLDGGVGHVQDRGAGSIVLLQLGDYRAWEVLLEVENVVDARSAPSVDRLVVVPDHTDVAPLVGEQPNEIQLRDVGVLKLIDQDMRELGCATCCESRADHEGVRRA